ncbi:MAG: DNA polymerase III subunit delta' C-terminal domain-containing protein [Buchnera aphidicola (Schlechtendalia peitan)]
MNLYPWLITYYNNIIYQFDKCKRNYSIILEAYKGIGITLLAKNIGLWLLCSHRNKKILHCQKCQNCQLMYAQAHPDWYNVTHSSNTNIIGIDTIRQLCSQIVKTSKKNGNKVIYFSNASQLTEHSINALLKILEEPPENTYFIFINYYPFSLLSTLRSRCILYKIPMPLEHISINWLKKNNIKIKQNTFKTALRINNGAPICAKNFIFKSLWKKRSTFYRNLRYSIINQNFLYMLNDFSLGDVENKIFWICSLLFDSIKIKYNYKNHITNLDKIDIIKDLEKKYSFYSLDESLRSWMRCNEKLTNISGINVELLLSAQLLRWGNILKFHEN